MIVTFIPVDGPVNIVDFGEGQEPVFKDMQEFCGGYLEHVNVLHEGKQCSMWVHEEGMIIGLSVNGRATEIYHAASRARGVDPNNPKQLKADREAGYEQMAKNLGIKREELGVVELGLERGPPVIHGPAILFHGRAT